MKSKALIVVVAAALVAVTGLAQTPGSGAKPAAPAQKAAPAAPQAAPAKPPAAPGTTDAPAAAPREQVGPSEVVLTIGPEKLTREQYESVKKGLPPQYAAAPQQMGERAFASSYAQFRSLALKAEQEKLNESPEFKGQMSFLHDQVLAQMVLGKLQAASQQVSDAEVKAYYDAHTGEMQQAKLRAIFVALAPPPKPAAKDAAGKDAAAAKSEAPKARTDDEAKTRAAELRKKLVEGADFATLAKENSDHQATAEKGGDFGTVRKGMLPANLEKIVFSLKPKEVSEPVKEGQGYYLFQVEDITPVTLDEATATIRNKLQQEKFQRSVEGVKGEFPVTLNDKYFAPPAAPVPAAATGAGADTQRPVITGVGAAKPGAAPSKPAPATPAPAKP